MTKIKSIELPSPNFDDRPEGMPIDFLIMHYTGMQSGQAALDRLRDPTAPVSSHYVVDEDGTVYALVAEEKRAWHAGITYWQGLRSLNARSIGIEIVNPGHEWGYRPFTKVQMDAVTKLAQGIIARHNIIPARVLGHSDVAPLRKEDPGELFDWQGLAENGVGLWVKPHPIKWTQGQFLSALELFGYDVNGPEGTDPKVAQNAAIVAFQRHFAPERLDGKIDDALSAILHGLLLETQSDLSKVG